MCSNSTFFWGTADVWYDMEVDFRGTSTSFPFHTLEQYQIDSFSDEAFGGNPAAVVVFPMTMPSINDKESWRPYLKWMQDIALENNLSETAFVAPREPTDNAGGNWVIRWMTPTKEVSIDVNEFYYCLDFHYFVVSSLPGGSMWSCNIGGSVCFKAIRLYSPNPRPHYIWIAIRNAFYWCQRYVQYT